MKQTRYTYRTHKIKKILYNTALNLDLAHVGGVRKKFKPNRDKALQSRFLLFQWNPINSRFMFTKTAHIHTHPHAFCLARSIFVLCKCLHARGTAQSRVCFMFTYFAFVAMLIIIFCAFRSFRRRNAAFNDLSAQETVYQQQ